jgi:geranylgeranyl diphosphate synthase type II
MSVKPECASDLEVLKAAIEACLTRYLPDQHRLPVPLWDAMAHGLLAGGKRLRPLLVCAALEAAGGERSEDLWRTCAAAEFIHTFSLVHDDLPCMDDDDLRRGQPTCHKRFGEGIAVLAGDALAVRAFEVLAGTGLPQLVTEFARATGAEGMVGGQVADVMAEGRPCGPTEVADIHRRKTAALFRACVRAGGILASATASQLQALSEYGEELGMAFQIKDDLLDLESSTERLGKTAGADLRHAKATYPQATSVTEAKAACRAHAERALAALSVFEAPTLLHDLAHLCIDREV